MKETEHGAYHQDDSGLWHYHSRPVAIDLAAADAISSKPKGVAWFWLEGTYAPICRDDSAIELICRWGNYKAAALYPQTAGISLIDLIRLHTKPVS